MNEDTFVSWVKDNPADAALVLSRCLGLIPPEVYGVLLDRKS